MLTTSRFLLKFLLLYTEQKTISKLVISNSRYIIFRMRKKIKRNTAFLLILRVGNDTGQLLKHAFKSLPGVKMKQDRRQFFSRQAR